MGNRIKNSFAHEKQDSVGVRAGENALRYEKPLCTFAERPVEDKKR